MPYCGEVVHPLKGIFAQLGKLEAFDFSRVRLTLKQLCDRMSVHFEDVLCIDIYTFLFSNQI